MDFLQVYTARCVTAVIRVVIVDVAEPVVRLIGFAFIQKILVVQRVVPALTVFETARVSAMCCNIYPEARPV